MHLSALIVLGEVAARVPGDEGPSVRLGLNLVVTGDSREGDLGPQFLRRKGRNKRVGFPGSKRSSKANAPSVGRLPSEN